MTSDKGRLALAKERLVILPKRTVQMEFNIHIPATEDPALIIVVGFAAPGALNHKQERVEVGVVHHRLPHRQVRRAVARRVLVQVVEVELLVVVHSITPLATARFPATKLPTEE